MASTPVRKILALLNQGTTEEAMAAAVVLGALAPREKAVVDGLTRALGQKENLPLALSAARALGKIGNAAALRALLPLLRAKGELRETGALAISGCGKAALPAIRKELADADFKTREVLFRILARMHTAESLKLVLETFFFSNFEVVKMAGRALREEAPRMTTAQKQAAAKTALTFLKSKPVRESRPATNSTLIYLDALSRPEAVPDLLRHTATDQPRSTRRHALNALRHTLIEAKIPAKVVEKVFPYLDDPDFEAVVMPSLAILEPADIPARYEKELKRLVGGRYYPVRQFAVRKLAQLTTRTSAGILMEVLDGKDEELRRSAVHALKQSPAAVDLLLPRLLAEKDPDQAWSLVHLIKPHAASLKGASLTRLKTTALKLLDKGDRRAEALLHLFRHADEKAFSQAFYKRALAAKKTRKYADAEKNLRLISRSAYFDNDAKFLLGLMMLKDAGKDMSRGRRAQEAFRRMAELQGFGLEKRIKKESRLLGTEGLFAIGFGLLEGQGATRTLGVKLLKAQIKKGARTKTARLAKEKLAAEGF